MPKCHEIYPNCIWHVPPERFGWNFNSALLSKVYRNYATHIIRVCVSPLGPINPQLHVSKMLVPKKCNLQVKFGSKAMANLYDLLCYLSLTSTDPLLEELLSYLPTPFHSHIFDYSAYEHSSDDESVHSIDSSVSAFYSDDSTYLDISYVTLLILSATPRFLPWGQAQDDIKRPPAENDRQPAPALGRLLDFPEASGLS